MKELFEDSLEWILLEIHSDRAEHPWDNVLCPLSQKGIFFPLVTFPGRFYSLRLRQEHKFWVRGSSVDGLGGAPCGRELWDTDLGCSAPRGLPSLVLLGAGAQTGGCLWFCVCPRAGAGGSVEEAAPGGCPEARSEAVPVLQLQGLPDCHGRGEGTAGCPAWHRGSCAHGGIGVWLGSKSWFCHIPGGFPWQSQLTEFLWMEGKALSAPPCWHSHQSRLSVTSTC